MLLEDHAPARILHTAFLGTVREQERNKLGRLLEAAGLGTKSWRKEGAEDTRPGKRRPQAEEVQKDTELWENTGHQKTARNLERLEQGLPRREDGRDPAEEGSRTQQGRKLSHSRELRVCLGLSGHHLEGVVTTAEKCGGPEGSRVGGGTHAQVGRHEAWRTGEAKCRRGSEGRRPSNHWRTGGAGREAMERCMLLCSLTWYLYWGRTLG